jgi:ribosomal protein L13E
VTSDELRVVSRLIIAACLSLALSAQTAWLASAQSDVKAESVDVRALLMEVALKEKSMLARRLEYTWTAKVTDRELGKRGEVKKETSSLYEVYPVRGEFARKLLERDGVPVSRERADSELKKAAERLEKAAREEQKRVESTRTQTPQPPEQSQNPSGFPSFGFSTGHRESNGFTSAEISLAVWRFFRYCEFSNPRRETFNNRESIVLDFRPRAGFHPADELQRPYARLRGRLWIDSADKTVARLEALPDDAPASAAEPEPAVVFEHARVAEGLWLERLVRIKTYGRKQLFNGIEIDFTKEVTDFKRFSSLAGDDRVDAPKVEEPKPTKP